MNVTTQYSNRTTTQWKQWAKGEKINTKQFSM